MPGGGERAGLGFAIADHHGDDEVGVVEGGAEAVGEAVAEFAAFVDGAGSFRRAVAADAAGKGELLEELLQAVGVLALLGIDLGVDAFEIAVGERGGRAVAGAGDVDQVEVVLLDEAVEVDPDEGLAGVGAPVAEQPVLDVLRLERLAQQRVRAQVEHADAEVVAGAPVGVVLRSSSAERGLGDGGGVLMMGPRGMRLNKCGSGVRGRGVEAKERAERCVALSASH